LTVNFKILKVLKTSTQSTMQKTCELPESEYECKDRSIFEEVIVVLLGEGNKKTTHDRVKTNTHSYRYTQNLKKTM